jgi:hypothetical protein
MALQSLMGIPGLGGYLGMEQYRQQQALGNLQGQVGLMNAVRQQQVAEQEAQLAPLRQQMVQAQLGQIQGAVQDAERKRAFFSPDNLKQFMTSGVSAVAPGAGVTGGMDSGATGQIMGVAPAENGAPAASAAKSQRMDLESFVTQGAMQGVFNPEALLNMQTRIQDRIAAREQRMEELKMQLENRAATEAEKRQFQLQLYQLQQQGREDMAKLAASMRQPRQDPLVQVEIDDPSKPGNKILRYVPQSQAAGMSPPTKATADKPLTEFQGKAVMFGSRAAQSDKVLRELETNVNTVSLAAKQAAGNVPLLGGILGAAGNVMLSDNQQRVEQAQRDFVNAILRQESGAVISDQEFNNAKKQYFPQPGDSRAVIEQKRKNREIAIGGFKRIAGPGSVDIDEIIKTPALPSGEQRSPDIDELVRKYSG